VVTWPLHAIHTPLALIRVNRPGLHDSRALVNVRDAVREAKRALADPKTKKAYVAKAAKQRRPVFSVAVSDFLKMGN